MDKTHITSAEKYINITKKKYVYLLGFSIFLALLFMIDISSGASDYTIIQILKTLFDADAMSIQMNVVIWDLRMPIAVMAILIGMSLSLAGAQMQTILNNPLADPFTLGIASAASFGAALAIVLGQGLPVGGQYMITANAFFFAFATSMALYAITRLRGVSSETMILVGIALMFTFGALLALLQYGSNETQLQQLIFWTMGSLGKSTWIKVLVSATLLVGSISFFYRNVWNMTALRLGDEKAQSMGVDVKKLRLKMLFVISLLSALSVSYVGVVGFVGLVGPHIARLIVGEDQRYFLPMSALAGAVLMSATSIISKTLVSGVIFPIGIITSLVGIPFFISLILKSRRNNW